MRSTTSGIDSTAPMYSRGGKHAKRGHVVAEERGLGPGELAPVLPSRHSALEQGVVDVGDVLHVVDVVAGIHPDPLNQVEGDVGGGVTQVRRVVRA